MFVIRERVYARSVVSGLRMSGVITPLCICVFVACIGIALPFICTSYSQSTSCFKIRSWGPKAVAGEGARGGSGATEFPRSKKVLNYW